jgi:hypothetical protein
MGLQQQVNASLGPVHLLLLDHSPADKLVYGRLGKSGADSFAVAMAVAVIRYAGLIVGDIFAEFATIWPRRLPIPHRVNTAG